MANGNPTPDITALLGAWRNGDAAAEARLLEVLYPAMRAIAQRALHPSAHRLSIGATELAHEAYLNLINKHREWACRAHFFAIAARVTRNVLIDLLRERSADKRGGGLEHLTLEGIADADLAGDAERIDWLALEQSLQQLERRDPTAAHIVELRYFGGLNNDEVASVLAVSVPTVVRHWKFARAWLHSRL